MSLLLIKEAIANRVPLRKDPTCTSIQHWTGSEWQTLLTEQEILANRLEGILSFTVGRGQTDQRSTTTQAQSAQSVVRGSTFGQSPSSQIASPPEATEPGTEPPYRSPRSHFVLSAIGWSLIALSAFIIWRLMTTLYGITASGLEAVGTRYLWPAGVGLTALLFLLAESLSDSKPSPQSY